MCRSPDGLSGGRDLENAPPLTEQAANPVGASVGTTWLSYFFTVGWSRVLRSLQRSVGICDKTSRINAMAGPLFEQGSEISGG